jgi:CheY-like chemotaxis protein
VHAGNHDILEALELVLAFLDNAERQGIGPATLLQQRALFRNSPLCTDLRNSHFIDPCSHCPLLGFVPAHRRFETLPCHHIPLNADGETITRIDFLNQQYKLYRLVKDWLQSAMRCLEQARNSNRGVEVLLLHQDGPLAGLRSLLDALGVQTVRTKTMRQASKLLEGPSLPSLLFTEPILPDGTWSDILDRLKKERIATALVVVSSEVDKELAIEVIERGAFDWLMYPVGVLGLAHIVRSALWSSCPRQLTLGGWDSEGHMI